MQFVQGGFFPFKYCYTGHITFFLANVHRPGISDPGYFSNTLSIPTKKFVFTKCCHAF